MTTFSKVDVSKYDLDEAEDTASPVMPPSPMAVDPLNGATSSFGFGVDDEDALRGHSCDASDVGKTFDIAGGKVHKTVKCAGTEFDTPCDGWDVEIKYTAIVPDCSSVPFVEMQRHRMAIGKGTLPIGVEHGIKSMREGEVSVFRLHPEMGFGAQGDVSKGVPPDSEVEYEVTLFKIIEVASFFNGKVVKRRLAKGTGWEMPHDHSEVVVRWSGRLAADGRVFQPECAPHATAMSNHL